MSLFCRRGQRARVGLPLTELRQPGLAGAADFERQILLAKTLLLPHTPERHPQLGGGADHLLTRGHSPLGIPINAQYRD